MSVVKLAENESIIESYKHLVLIKREKPLDDPFSSPTYYVAKLDWRRTHPVKIGDFTVSERQARKWFANKVEELRKRNNPPERS